MDNMEQEQFEGLPLEAKANVLIQHMMTLIDQLCQTKITLDSVMHAHAQQEGGVEPPEFGEDFDITGNEVMQREEEE
jgi:hypothetical protein